MAREGVHKNWPCKRAGYPPTPVPSSSSRPPTIHTRPGPGPTPRQRHPPDSTMKRPKSRASVARPLASAAGMATLGASSTMCILSCGRLCSAAAAYWAASRRARSSCGARCRGEVVRAGERGLGADARGGEVGEREGGAGPGLQLAWLLQKLLQDPLPSCLPVPASASVPGWWPGR